MKILGINQVPGLIAWNHDSAAALVVDGKLIATAEEERFNRIRHASGYPKAAVGYCLKEGGLSLKDIDVLAVAYNPWAPVTRLRLTLRPWNLFATFFNIAVLHIYLKNLLRQAGSRAKIVYIDHHLAHASSTYRCSGFENANILTIDGSGETESFAFFTGEKGVIRRVWDIPLGGPFDAKKWSSIGLVYSRVTNFLSLGTNGEGKTMGLASYGAPKYDFSSILSIKDHRTYRIDRRKVGELYKALERTDGRGEITQEQKDLAASLQEALETSAVALAKEAHAHSGHRNIALAGGVALNCNMNSRILAEDFCDRVFIQPAANDAGVALGAALEASARAGEKPDFKLEHAYWGPGYSAKEIEQALKETKMPYERPASIVEATADLVAEGKIVGWFQGRMELGPRALGNRSILANPTIPGMHDKVNVDVKHREVWRPFAPAVTEEDAPAYFEGVSKAKESPFMLETFYVKEAFRGKLPAITHIDGSARIQTVRKDQNERLYQLLLALKARTGHPVVLNTSFNDAGEPIVCTPRDAIRCFYSTGFDALAIGDFLLRKQ